MHADRDDDRIRGINADWACLCQRLSFTDVVEGMNAALKRVPQFNTPALSIPDAPFVRHLYANNHVLTVWYPINQWKLAHLLFLWSEEYPTV